MLCIYGSKRKAVTTAIPKELTHFNFTRYINLTRVGNHAIVFTCYKICRHSATRNSKDGSCHSYLKGIFSLSLSSSKSLCLVYGNTINQLCRFRFPSVNFCAIRTATLKYATDFKSVNMAIRPLCVFR